MEKIMEKILVPLLTVSVSVHHCSDRCSSNDAGCRVTAHAEFFMTDNTQHLQAERELRKKSSTSTGGRAIPTPGQPCRWLRICKGTHAELFVTDTPQNLQAGAELRNKAGSIGHHCYASTMAKTQDVG